MYGSCSAGWISGSWNNRRSNGSTTLWRRGTGAAAAEDEEDSEPRAPSAAVTDIATRRARLSSLSEDCYCCLQLQLLHWVTLRGPVWA